MKLTSLLFALCSSLVLPLWAQAPADSAVTGTIFDPANGKPVEFATVVVSAKADGKPVRAGATNAKGAFDLEGIPAGDYQLAYALVGGAREAVVPFSVDAQLRKIDLGRLPLGDDPTVKLEKVEVAARKEAFYNSIDRKVYNVGKDIQSAAGSASDLLQNVPSVQVDIEGNVSLRGDANVLILINGKTSAMMGKNRAAVLEQMPADGIEKIEVITNPSAKFKPDGTAGIINLTLKKKAEAGSFGSMRASVGNDGRYNASVAASYPLGKVLLFANASVRQDDRSRRVQDDRAHRDGASNAFISTSQRTTEHSKPFSRLAQLGTDCKLDDHTKLGGNVRYNFRDFRRTSTVTNVSRSAAGATTGDTDRLRLDLEWEKDLEFTGTLEHAFAEEDREIKIELRHGKTDEQEDNRYTNVYRAPVRAPLLDFTLIRQQETNTEVSADYTRPLGEKSKFELGYNGQFNEADQNFRGSFIDATGAPRVDPTRTNHFIYDAAIHALYGTYARKFGAFGLLAGLRFERAVIDTNQVTARLTGSNDYNRFYPSLHTSYDLTGTQQLQLNYSHPSIAPRATT